MGKPEFFLEIDFSHEKKTFKTWGMSLQLPYANRATFCYCGGVPRPPEGVIFVNFAHEVSSMC